MIEIERGSLEARIIEVLLEVYPITTKELRRELSLSEKMLDKGLKRLQTHGIIQLGRKATQRKPIKRTGRKKQQKDYESFAYG